MPTVKKKKKKKNYYDELVLILCQQFQFAFPEFIVNLLFLLLFYSMVGYRYCLKSCLPEPFAVVSVV